MLFNSPIFLFAFLPVTLLLFFVIGRFSITGARVWLSGASLFFYGWWNPVYLLLIVFSIIVNFYCGLALQNFDRDLGWQDVLRRSLSKKSLLIVGLAFNLVILGYFKYFMFFVRNVNDVAGTSFNVPHIILPLAISFFTFQKIAYLVDSYIGKAKEDNFLNFLLFVSFFPQLIAGPIVHYSELLPQLREERIYRFNAANFADGASLFLLGLAKKVIFADAFASYADPAFAGAAHGAQLSFLAAWLSALAYTLQLYFDFSGYSDMAIGLARMMNIELPLNFTSPYKARNIIEFWRRWHMTLSRFLREYIYIPLGGNRHGRLRRYFNLFATMLIGGAWHGANWTFVVWGGLHGLYLSANHLLVETRGPARPGLVRAIFAHGATLLCVVIAWVIFRAPSLDAARHIYAGMLGQNGYLLPAQVLQLVPPLGHIFASVPAVPFLGDSTVMGCFEIFVMIAAGFAIALWSPNLYEMSRRTRLIMVALSFAFTFQKVVFASAISSFIYFQF